MLSELSDSSLCSATRKLKVIYNGVNKMSSTNEVYLSRSLQSAMLPLLLYKYDRFTMFTMSYSLRLGLFLYKNYLAIDFT